MSTSHVGFLELVSSIWNFSITGNLMVKVILKLKMVKSTLKTWNKVVFGNFHQQVKDAGGLK